MSFNTKKYTYKLIDNGDASLLLEGSQCLFFSKQWSVSVEVSGLNGTPILNLFHSIDGVNWVIIDDCVKDISLTENLIIQDEYFPNNYIKISIDPGDNTSGNITATLNLKTQ